MESLALIMKNALIGAIGGLLAWIIDVSKGKKTSRSLAISKVLAGGFLAHVSTPTIIENIGYTDEGFISAIIGICAYKVIEYLMSGEFLDKGKEVVLSFLVKK